MTTNGLDNDAELVHLMHIHAGAKGECPPASAARLHNGHLSISTTDGINYYGPAVQALTTRGDTSPSSILAFPRFLTGGALRLHAHDHAAGKRRRGHSQEQCRRRRTRRRLRRQRHLQRGARSERTQQERARNGDRAGPLRPPDRRPDRRGGDSALPRALARLYGVAPWTATPRASRHAECSSVTSVNRPPPCRRRAVKLVPAARLSAARGVRSGRHRRDR